MIWGKKNSISCIILKSSVEIELQTRTSVYEGLGKKPVKSVAEKSKIYIGDNKIIYCTLLTVSEIRSHVFVFARQG